MVTDTLNTALKAAEKAGKLAMVNMRAAAKRFKYSACIMGVSFYDAKLH